MQEEQRNMERLQREKNKGKEKAEQKDKGNRKAQPKAVRSQHASPTSVPRKPKAQKARPSWRFCDAAMLARFRRELSSPPAGSVVGTQVESEFVMNEEAQQEENAGNNSGKRKRTHNTWFKGVLVADHGNNLYDILFEGEDGAKSEIWTDMQLNEHFRYAGTGTQASGNQECKRGKSGGNGMHTCRSSGEDKLFAL